MNTIGRHGKTKTEAPARRCGHGRVQGPQATGADRPERAGILGSATRRAGTATDRVDRGSGDRGGRKKAGRLNALRGTQQNAPNCRGSDHGCTSQSSSSPAATDTTAARTQPASRTRDERKAKVISSGHAFAHEAEPLGVQQLQLGHAQSGGNRGCCINARDDFAAFVFRDSGLSGVGKLSNLSLIQAGAFSDYFERVVHAR